MGWATGFVLPDPGVLVLCTALGLVTIDPVDKCVVAVPEVEPEGRAVGWFPMGAGGMALGGGADAPGVATVSGCPYRP